MSYEIRTALPADRDGIYAVEQLCSGMPWSKGQIAEELENACSYTVVAEEAGEIIGFASAHILQGDAHLNELGVLPAHRRRGIARALLGDVLRETGADGVDGMLFDLGVSSPQLDDASRGFSYMQDAPLDMRMDLDAALTAYEIVNTWSGDELRRILFEYGEERYAPAIARAIVKARENAPVKTTLELVDIIKGAMPPAALREKQHPAKRSFQAIRIAVNGELDALTPMLIDGVAALNPGGRLAVITFHSLEDRIVKRAMQDLSRGCTCPPAFPVCVCGKKPKVKVLTRKPIVSGEAELEENPRARSAKLRVAEKCDSFDL